MIEPIGKTQTIKLGKKFNKYGKLKRLPNSVPLKGKIKEDETTWTGSGYCYAPKGISCSLECELCIYNKKANQSKKKK